MIKILNLVFYFFFHFSPVNLPLGPDSQIQNHMMYIHNGGNVTPSLGFSVPNPGNSS